MVLDYKQLPDGELIALLKAQDELAFAEIYDRYSMLVYFKVNQMLKDEIYSKDIVQDLFTTIWEKATSIKEDANLAGYLYIAARNRVLKSIQKGKTKSDFLNELGKYSESVSFETIDKINADELMALIQTEISQLSPRMREIFHLSRIEDLSHKEIAAKLGISEATVRKQVQYALRKLRLQLDRHTALGLLLLVLLRIR